MIWDKLNLPPVSPECLGIMYSCREARVELQEAAVRNLNAYLKEWKRETERAISPYLVGVPAPFQKEEFAMLREITVTVPTKIITSPIGSTARSELFQRLHSLCATYFRSITVQFDRPCLSMVSRQPDSYDFELEMDMVFNQCHVTQTMCHFIDTFPYHRQGYVPRLLNTEQIRFEQTFQDDKKPASRIHRCWVVATRGSRLTYEDGMSYFGTWFWVATDDTTLEYNGVPWYEI